MDLIINVMMVISVILVIFLFLKSQSQGLKREFEWHLHKELNHVISGKDDILTEEDMNALPAPVQKYLRIVRTVGKEKVRNFRVVFEGEFRTGPQKEWRKVEGIQFNDLTDPTRLYYMEMKMFGLPVSGFHHYESGHATMQAKIAGMVTVVNGKGPQMDAGETVTVLNDMCLLAPASLIDPRITWQTIDPLTVKATFDNNGIIVSAFLYFNDKGELCNFVSDDRYYSPTGKTYQKFRWSTPVNAYLDYHGINISSGGEAVWTLPEGDFSYGRIKIKEIQYNVEN